MNSGGQKKERLFKVVHLFSSYMMWWYEIKLTKFSYAFDKIIALD